MSEYWIERELEHIRNSIMSDEQKAIRIRRIYEDSMNNIQQRIDMFYARYAEREGITMAEARRRATNLEIEEYAKKAAIYVREKNLTTTANREMALYNVTMSVNRLELLRAYINLELIGMTSDIEKLLETMMTQDAMREFSRQAGILQSTLLANTESVTAIVNSSFLSATWSERLWVNQAELRMELDRLLNRAILQGRGSGFIAKFLERRFNVSKGDAVRLAVTELARVQAEVQKRSYQTSIFNTYQFIAEPSACPICKALDNKIFDVEDMMPGVNAQPMHPHCRCTTAAYIDREAWDIALRARGL